LARFDANGRAAQARCVWLRIEQKYGTNRFINQKTGKEELAPIDRATTDAERARYGVPPLADLLERYPEAPVG